MEALYRSGQADYALSLLTAHTDRSWSHMLDVGSTLTLEAWDTRFKPNQDWNHAWGAAPANIIPRLLMGVEPLEPGFRRIRIRPQPGGLAEASLRLPTVRGTVQVRFKTAARKMHLQIDLPSNTTAQVWVPRQGTQATSVLVDGVQRRGHIETDSIVFDSIGSGSHTFDPVPEDPRSQRSVPEMFMTHASEGQTPVPGSSLLPPPASDLQAHAAVDPRVRRYILPTRVVWQSKAGGAIVETPEKLLIAGSGQVTLSHPAACVLRHNGKTPGLLLDFGRELHGGVQIAVSDLKAVGDHGKTVRLRVRFGESVSEAMSELGEKNAQTDHAVRDQFCQAPWLGTVEVGNTGFRFVRIDLVEPGAMVALHSVRAVFLYRDLPYLGSFRCNDDRLNRIWQTGAYTVHLNMQDYLWDGIKRDRLVWIGDMHPETMTIGTVFGMTDIVPQSLDLIRSETPLPQWMNGISSYSLWWVLIQRSWYRQGGDLAYLKRQQTYLTGLMQELTKHIGANNEETLPEGRFLDWPSNENKPAIHAGLHALLILTFQAGAEMCEALGDAATRKQCMDAVVRLKKHVPDPNHSKQAAALMALAGLGDPVTLNREVLAVDGAKRLSTFYGYYVLEARAKAGDYQGCLDIIRQYWGGMLDMGATTFWEDFDLDWMQNAGRIDELVPPGKKDIHGDYGAWCYIGFRHSLCHGWASGPTPWLSEHVLGIQIVEPGCKTVRIAPHLGDLQWAEGSFPLPQGVLKVRHEKQADGSLKTTVEAPPGVHILR